MLLNLPSVSISGAIGPAGDHDWFKIDLPGDGLFTVETTGSMDTEAALLDASLSRIAADDDSGADGNFKLERYMQPGIYYIEVNELGDSGTGDYTLKAEFAQDIGDDRQSAEPLVTSGAGIPTALEIADDADWYKLSLDQPKALTVDTSGGLDTYGRLYNADGSVIIKEDDNSGSGDNFRIERSLAPGTYYVEVRENGDDAAGGYTLTADWSAASAVKSFNGHHYEFVGEPCLLDGSQDAGREHLVRWTIRLSVHHREPGRKCFSGRLCGRKRLLDRSQRCRERGRVDMGKPGRRREYAWTNFMKIGTQANLMGVAVKIMPSSETLPGMTPPLLLPFTTSLNMVGAKLISTSSR